MNVRVDDVVETYYVPQSCVMESESELHTCLDFKKPSCSSYVVRGVRALGLVMLILIFTHLHFVNFHVAFTNHKINDI